MEPIIATVWTANGEKTKLQAAPSAFCDDYFYIPNWTQVCVTGITDDWAQITIGAFVGYIKKERLIIGGGAHETDSGTV